MEQFILAQKPQWRLNIERLYYDHYIHLALAGFVPSRMATCPTCAGRGCIDCGYSGERCE
jgi:hypothetical protein